MSDTKKIIVVGGVAGGASFAARARRIDETAEITIIEKGPYVSFANCGLPYHIGGAIQDRAMLLLHTPESLAERYRINARVNCEATAIDSAAKTVTVVDSTTGKTETLPYDILLLSPGAEAFIPPVPGADRPNVFALQTIPQMDKIIAWIIEKKPKHATVVGAGFIGIEVAENLVERGIRVTVVEMLNQVLPPVDEDIAEVLHQHLGLHGVELRLGARLEAITDNGSKTILSVAGGGTIHTDMVIMSVGVRPRTALAQTAGVALGDRKGIRVDEMMKTNVEGIFAVGDAVEVVFPVDGSSALIPMAGPANRQARIAADNALGYTDSRYRGSLGTAICKVFDLAVATVGASEKLCKKNNIPHLKTIIHPASHAGYYPGSFPIMLKLLFAPDTGKILGAQAVGAAGVDKRIDVISTAMAGGMTVYDLEHLELCYAPPFGSAKDAVNYAGFTAANILRGSMTPFYAEDVPAINKDKQALLDVRDNEETFAGKIPGAIHIPLHSLRQRMSELPAGKAFIVYCQTGLRSYIACRMLTQKGLTCSNLIGGYKSYALKFEKTQLLQPIPYTTEPFCSTPEKAPEAACEPSATQTGDVIELNACGLQCPGPLLKLRESMDTLTPGKRLRVIATDPGFAKDAQAWCAASGNRCIEVRADSGKVIAVIEKSAPVALSPDIVKSAVASGKKSLTMVVFSNDLDRAMAAFIIANGAAAMGLKVNLFFTFWGLNILRKPDGPAVSKTLIEKMFGWMMPKGANKLTLSKMNMAGMGTMMMKDVMKKKNVSSLQDLIRSAQDSGVKMIACTMTMDIMGIKREELISGIEEGGVATYLGDASDSAVNLFV